MCKALVNYFDDFWGIDIENFRGENTFFPTFEECLGVLYLAYNRGETFKGYDRGIIEIIRWALIVLIAKVLEEKLKNKIIHHRTLVDRLIKEEKLFDTSFISLNYDIIIDNILVKLYPNYHLDYSIDFINFQREDDWDKPEPDKSILLLKPHGSLNWLYCPTCNTMERTPKKVTNTFYFENPCDSCSTPLKPVIIPPTFFKVMTNPFIQQVYFMTDKILRECEDIFVCGYSFPDVDIHIKYLLKRAERYNENTPKIYVINEHQHKKPNRRKDEEERFKRFFKEKENVVYTKKSFEEFCISGTN